MSRTPFVASALVAALAFASSAMAQTAAAPAAAKPAAAKPAAAKPAAKPQTAASAEPGQASAEQLAAAERVHYGTYQCEFGKTAEVSTLAKYKGYVEVKSGKSSWLMKPVASSTGAIRLEDLKGQFLVIQIANKSMLFDSKSGQRLLDGCVNAAQADAADRVKAASAQTAVK
jgi:glucose/arabinose dehydrogenase